MRLILLQLVVLFFITTNGNAHYSIPESEDSDPVITTQPLNQLECEGNLVKFKVIASGSGLTYTWKRKRPIDVDFVTIVDEPNNSEDSSTNEIRILSTGSAKYPNGTQFQVIVSNGSSSVTSDIATLTVNEITDLTGGTNVTQCFGTNYSYTVTTSYPANVVSYRWKKSITSGVWDEISDGSIYSGTTTATLNITGGTPEESGRYRVYITFNSSGADCNVTSTSRTRQITFLPQLTTPETTILQPTCVVNTGTITVAVQSETDVYSFDGGLNFQNSNEKSGLVVGPYNVIIKNAAGCISPTMICPIVEVGQASVWDGMTWQNGDPDSSRSVVFEQNFSSIVDIEACYCEVTNGANVVINGAHTLKVTNAVNVVDGKLTFENNASLVQVNDDVVNSGNINYKRYTTPVRRYDYTYWSSPVDGQTLRNLSPNTFYDKYFSYSNGWAPHNYGDLIMNAGEGYSIRAPQTFSITTAAIDDKPEFIGVPNNGEVKKTLTGDQVYLLGNPYPSAIDADVFLDLNSTVLEGTLYFWTHNSPPSSAIDGDKKYNYTTNDYAIYNRTGGVTTQKKALSGGYEPLGKIAAGQGFFAPASAIGGELLFNNSMRISGGVSGINNAQFFKINTTAKEGITPEREKNRIWLNLTNTEGVFKQTLIGYITGATNNYDAGFDGVTYDGNPFVDFYSVNQGLNLTIQGRALPFKKQDSVVLGCKSTIQGEFQISIDHTDGILDFESVFLEDKDLQLLHDLKKEPYLFTTEKGVFNNRFVLRYVDKNEEEVVEQELVEEVINPAVIVSVEGRKIKINSAATTLEKVAVYSISGRKMFQKNQVNENVFVIPQLISGNQVVVVDMLLSNGKKICRKIIY
ncbi:hypothetical protein AAGV33_02345 [Flavobacterium sp. FBOR7N2.3]|uniref:Ig-like domain-containing protein n=1 Tax=Flavobacterium magnesitis TaxID=3138077 RepID=A0ABV4TGX6_9FLAO